MAYYGLPRDFLGEGFVLDLHDGACLKTTQSNGIYLSIYLSFPLLPSAPPYCVFDMKRSPDTVLLLTHGDSALSINLSRPG